MFFEFQRILSLTETQTLRHTQKERREKKEHGVKEGFGQDGTSAKRRTWWLECELCQIDEEGQEGWTEETPVLVHALLDRLLLSSAGKMDE